MDECPRCDNVDNLHPLPPSIITKELIDIIGRDEEGDFKACAECIDELMQS